MKNNINEPTKVQIDAHAKYMCMQRKEMLGEVNRYYAFLKMHRPVSDSEAIMYYIENGGAEKFFHRFGHIICPFIKNEQQ